MKLKFKKQSFQTDAVNAVADCFAGQPKTEGVAYRIDPGKTGRAYKSGQTQSGFDFSQSGFKNRELLLTKDQLLANIYAVQQRQNLPQSTALVSTKVCAVNLDIEMETGTGKTYCYIKTMFELNRRYGWSKFIVVVPLRFAKGSINPSRLPPSTSWRNTKSAPGSSSTIQSSCIIWSSSPRMAALTS